MPRSTALHAAPLARLLLLLSRVPSWFRVALPIALWGSATALFATTATTTGPPLGPLQAAFSALRLFTLDPPGYPRDPLHPAGVALWAVTILSPLLTATAAADFVRRHLLSGEVLARGFARHTVVCGMGNHGRVIARECARRGERVIVLDSKPGGVGTTLDLDGGEALVLQGDMTVRDALLAAGVHRARRVFLAAGDPLVNMEAARLVRALVEELGARPPRLHALVDEAESLLPILDPLGLRGEDLVDQFAHAARCLVEGPEVRAVLGRVVAGQLPPRIAIIGFGRFGQSVLRYLLESPCLPPQAEGGPALQVELVDRLADHRAARFAERVRAHGWTLIAPHGGDAEEWVAGHVGGCAPAARAGVVFLCVDNDPLSLHCGARLREGGGEVEVVLRMARPLQGRGAGVVTCSVPELFGQTVGRLLEG